MQSCLPLLVLFRSVYIMYHFPVLPGKASNFTDDYPLSWSVPAYHPPTQQYQNAKVKVNCCNAVLTVSASLATKQYNYHVYQHSLIPSVTRSCRGLAQYPLSMTCPYWRWTDSVPSSSVLSPVHTEGGLVHYPVWTTLFLSIVKVDWPSTQLQWPFPCPYRMWTGPVPSFSDLSPVQVEGGLGQYPASVTIPLFMLKVDWDSTQLQWPFPCSCWRWNGPVPSFSDISAVHAEGGLAQWPFLCPCWRRTGSCSGVAPVHAEDRLTQYQASVTFLLSMLKIWPSAQLQWLVHCPCWRCAPGRMASFTWTWCVRSRSARCPAAPCRTSRAATSPCSFYRTGPRRRRTSRSSWLLVSTSLTSLSSTPRSIWVRQWRFEVCHVVREVSRL